MTSAEEYRDKVDRRGFVNIQNGDDTAKVVPESVQVWVDRGWKVVDADKPASKRSRKPTKAAEPES